MKRFLAILLLSMLVFSFASCAYMSGSELQDFVSSSAKRFRDTAYGFDSYSMTYTTIMFSNSAQKYVSFSVSSVFDRKSGITCSEILLDGSSYMSFFIKGDKVYYDTILGEEKKISASVDSISDFRYLTDVEARLAVATLPLTLSASELREMKTKVYVNTENEKTSYTFSLGKKFLEYACENTSGVFETVLMQSQSSLNNVKIEEYEISYVLNESGSVEAITDVNKFTVKSNGSTLTYDCGVSIKKYNGTLEFDESKYSSSDVGEYIKNNEKDGLFICQ